MGQGPGCVEPAGGAMSVTFKPTDENRWSRSRTPATCAALEDLGVDPTSVVRGSLTSDWYEVFVLDDQSNRQLDPNRINEVLKMRVPWPDTISETQVDELLRTWRTEATK